MKDTEIKLTKLAKCAGCGAKVGAGTLAKLLGDMPSRHDDALIVGYDRSDDACVYKLGEHLAVVETVDFFPPISDDPETFGAIAAANALSDIYAMGGEPKLALNLLCIPKDMSNEAVHAILKGSAKKVYEAGAVIAGGHSIYDDEPKYGLAVTGTVDPARVLTNCGAREGDALILTKPIGIGILTTARKAGLVEEAQSKELDLLMSTLNKYARDIMVKYRVHGCTDVTGFSLMGHLSELMQGSLTAAYLDKSALDILPRALEFAKMGILPEGMYRNREFAARYVELDDLDRSLADVLFDPQTSGGLLMSVDSADADALLSELRADSRVPSARLIGRVVKKGTGDKCIFVR